MAVSTVVASVSLPLRQAQAASHSHVCQCGAVTVASNGRASVSVAVPSKQTAALVASGEPQDESGGDSGRSSIRTSDATDGGRIGGVSGDGRRRRCRKSHWTGRVVTVDEAAFA